MTDDDGLSELDRALNALKPVAEPADTPPVVAPSSDPRMSWDTVIDRESEVASDDPVAPRPAASNFQFDLGSAMTGRTESDDAPSAQTEVAPIAAAVAPPLETRRPVEQVPAGPVVPPLDVRRPTQPTQPTPAEPAPAHTSGNGPEAASTAPPLERRTPLESREQPTPTRTVFDDEASGAARAALHRVPAGSSIAEAAGVKIALPALPAVAPPTPSTVPFQAAAVEAPTVSDVRAYRTAQQRAAKRNGQGRLIGRAFLVIVLLGGLIGGALLFGRSYLFPTEWDPALTPLVDEIQEEQGAEFVEPIELITQSEAEYAATLARLVVPGGWDDELPVWRALGIAGGSPTAESVGASLASAQPALFDPESESIVQLADADASDVEEALRAALEQGFEFQRGNSANTAEADADADTNATDTGGATDETDGPLGFLGVTDHRTLIDRSLDATLSNTATLLAGEAAELPAAADVPLPVAYELAATARLGPAVAAAAADAGVILTPGGEHPASVYAVFLPPGQLATLPAVLGAGETVSAPAVALSSDDWRLVLGARLSPDAADSTVAALTANSYASFDRAGAACFAAVFEFGDAATAQAGIDGVAAWVTALPVASQAVVTPIDFTTLQVVACDPGTADPIAVDASWADTVLDGQLARLSTPS